ncbi:MAG: hypothetical protein ABIN48_05790 [Ginsengibacter sp.]
MVQEETATDKLQAIANTSDLNVAIKRLEAKRFLQEEDLKTHFHVILNDLKPTNILRNTLKEVQESTPLKHNLLKVALGLGVGYFSRKMVVGKSAGVAKKALGAILQYGITSFVAKKGYNENEPSRPKKGFLKRLLSTKI